MKQTKKQYLIQWTSQMVVVTIAMFIWYQTENIILTIVTVIVLGGASGVVSLLCIPNSKDKSSDKTHTE